MSPFDQVWRFIVRKVLNVISDKISEIVKKQKTKQYLILFVILGSLFLCISILLYRSYYRINLKTRNIIHSVLVKEYERDRSPYKGLVAFLLSDTIWIPKDSDTNETRTFVNSVTAKFAEEYLHLKDKIREDSIELDFTPPKGVIREIHFWDKDSSFYGRLPIASLTGILGEQLPRVENMGANKRFQIKHYLSFPCFVGKTLSKLLRQDNRIAGRPCVQAYYCIDNGVFVIARSGILNKQPRYYKENFPEVIFLPDRPQFQQTVNRQSSEELSAAPVRPFFSEEYLDIAGCGWVYTMAMNQQQLFNEINIADRPLTKAVVYFDFDLNDIRLKKIDNLLHGLGLRYYNLDPKAVMGVTGKTEFSSSVDKGREPADSISNLSKWYQDILLALLKYIRLAKPFNYDRDSSPAQVIDAIRKHIQKELINIPPESTQLVGNKIRAKLFTDINAYHDSTKAICYFLIPVSTTSGQSMADSAIMTSFLYLPINIGKLQERTTQLGTYSVVFLALGIFSFTVIFSLVLFIVNKDRIALTSARSEFIKKTKIAFLILDEHGKIRYSNPKASEIFNIEEFKKYDFADVVDKQYKDFHRNVLERRKHGRYWPPYIIEFDKDKQILKDSYMQKHGNRICVAGGPAELFDSKTEAKSKDKELKPPTLGLVLSMDKSVDVLQARRVVLLHCKGFFEEKFVLFQKRYNDKNGEKHLLLDTAEYRDEDLLILPQTRLLIQRADSIIIGFEEKNRHQEDLLKYSFLPELGLGLSNEDIRVYIIMKDSKKEIQNFDGRIEFYHLDANSINNFDEFLEERIIIRIEIRSKELETVYWTRLDSEIVI